MIIRKFIFLFLLLTISENSFAQDTLRLEGNYQGKNIYFSDIYNNTGTGFCTQKVLVNNNVVPFDSSSAYEIKLTSMNFKMGAPLEIKIIHETGCLPKLIQSEFNCFPKSNYQIISIQIENDSILKWTSSENGGKFYYTIEQFRWNKWVKCGEVASTSGFDTTSYIFNIKKNLHTGENQFRVSVVDYSKTPTHSIVVKTNQPEIKIFMNSRCNGSITFQQDTFWEIYDKEGNIIEKGYGHSVSIAGFKRGVYYLNYDNTTAEFYGTK